MVFRICLCRFFTTRFSQTRENFDFCTRGDHLAEVSRLRTFLTVTAILVGTFTLVLTNDLGDGLRDCVDKQAKNIEWNRVLLIRKKFERKGEQRNPDKPVEYQEGKQEEGASAFNYPNFCVTNLPRIF